MLPKAHLWQPKSAPLDDDERIGAKPAIYFPQVSTDARRGADYQPANLALRPLRALLKTDYRLRRPDAAGTVLAQRTALEEAIKQAGLDLPSGRRALHDLVLADDLGRILPGSEAAIFAAADPPPVETEVRAQAARYLGIPTIGIHTQSGDTPPIQHLSTAQVYAPFVFDHQLALRSDGTTMQFYQDELRPLLQQVAADRRRKPLFDSPMQLAAADYFGECEQIDITALRQALDKWIQRNTAAKEPPPTGKAGLRRFLFK